MKKFALILVGILSITPVLQAQSFYGLQNSGTVLTNFTSSGTLLNNVSITGLSGDTSLVDLDFFTSSNGQLYSLGNAGNLYTLNPLTGAATLNVSNPGLGSPTAIDFNPVANRLRVFSGTSNFRVTPGTGTFTSDGTLAYVSGDANFGATPNLVAAAYTRNFGSPGTTSLYSIDASLDTLVLHSVTPQFNSLNTVGSITLGGLAFNVGSDTGFDIYSLGGSDVAYLSSGNSIYTVDLTSGALTNFTTAATLGSLTDIAAVPEPSTYALLGLGALGLFLKLRPRKMLPVQIALD